MLKIAVLAALASASAGKTSEPMTIAQVSDYIDEADVDQDGKVSMEEIRNDLAKDLVDVEAAVGKPNADGLQLLSLHAEDMEAIADAFAKADADQDGKLSEEEIANSKPFQDAMWEEEVDHVAREGGHATAEDVQQYIAEVDEDTDGEVSFDELMADTLKNVRPESNVSLLEVESTERELMAGAFKAADRDGSGRLSAQEILDSEQLQEEIWTVQAIPAANKAADGASQAGVLALLEAGATEDDAEASSDSGDSADVPEANASAAASAFDVRLAAEAQAEQLEE